LLEHLPDASALVVDDLPPYQGNRNVPSFVPKTQSSSSEPSISLEVMTEREQLIARAGAIARARASAASKMALRPSRHHPVGAPSLELSPRHDEPVLGDVLDQLAIRARH
jgi:hypothetical protein